MSSCNSRQGGRRECIYELEVWVIVSEGMGNKPPKAWPPFGSSDWCEPELEPEQGKMGMLLRSRLVNLALGYSNGAANLKRQMNGRRCPQSLSRRRSSCHFIVGTDGVHAYAR